MTVLDPMLLKAIDRHKSGRTAEAKAMYERILRRHPHDADALNFLGMLLFERGDHARGVELLRKSVEILPGNPHAWMNLGKMLVGIGQPEKGAEAYAKATELAPENCQAWFNRATCLRHLRRFGEAMQCLSATITLKPDHDDAYEQLGRILYMCGKHEERANLCRDWLANNPDSARARHMHAAVTGGDTPERASDEYVRAEFDDFAESFETNLNRLGYRAPQVLADALARFAQPGDSAAKPDILDAGAGTGLCGDLLCARAGTLTGVDLSPGMLEKARNRGCYDELVVMELGEFMRSRPAAFDIVVSADTLVYFGALEEVLAAAHQCLRPGGLLAFTVEQWTTDTDDARFTLGASGRYQHAAGYLQSALHAAKFVVRERELVVLRSELDAGVQGFAVVAAKG
jgi:predicted TPR repeat methyltransferase